MSLEGKKPPNNYNWREDLARFGAMLTHFFPLWIVAVTAVAAGLLLPALLRFKKSGLTVIVYTSQDQIYAEPILKEFEKQTGIRVRALYDSEAVKTVGLANRLLAERRNPQCDVFWGNEELRTRQLATKNVFRETNAWATVGFRSRRIVINTNFVSLRPTPNPSKEGTIAGPQHRANSPPGRGQGWVAPRSLLELTNKIWRGKVALAYPLFGTTATHFLTLRQHWGEANWQAWCRALLANKPLLVDGNSVVVRLVAHGEAWIGLTDSDDIAAAQREGHPVAALPLSDGSLLIPNTVAVIRRAPHPESAQRLFEHLQRREVVERLIDVRALEGLSPKEVNTPTLKPDWTALLGDLDSATTTLTEMFLR